MDPTTPAEEKKLFSSCASTRQFLFNKIDPFEQETWPWELPFAGSDALVEIFPNMLSGSALMEHALSVISDAPTFGVVVVRLDHDHGEDGSATAEIDLNRIVETGKNIAQTSGGYNSIWGQLGHDTWGCFLPDADEAACTQWCNSLKADLAEQTLPGVTVGIAVYPCIDFARSQIVENAWKALHHATFFGPDAAAVFDAVSLNISGDWYYQKGDIPGAIREFKAAPGPGPVQCQCSQQPGGLLQRSGGIQIRPGRI